jgi:hypothetical protein
MKITKTYADAGAQPESVSSDEAREHLEGRGYYRPGTVDAVLTDNKPIDLRTPWAFYHFEP